MSSDAQTLAEGKLLVDYENGRVLRADDEVIVSERFLDSHPFAARPLEGCTQGDTVFVGPDAKRRALARQSGNGENGLDAVEYEISVRIAEMLTMRKKEDA